MPLYEYQCNTCGRRTELLQRFSDAPLAACPECGGAVRKLPSAPAVQFKGTGWYVTDYARASKGNGDGATTKAAGAEKAAGASKKGSTEKVHAGAGSAEGTSS